MIDSLELARKIPLYFANQTALLGIVEQYMSQERIAQVLVGQFSVKKGLDEFV